MIALSHRCTKCGSEYTYYASGYSGRENDKDLCPECKKKVLAVLDSIQRIFEGRRFEITGEVPDGVIDGVIEKKKKHDEWLASDHGPTFVRVFAPANLPKEYDFSCAAVIDHRKYIIEAPSADRIDDPMTKVYVIKEYDLVNNRFTDQYWLDNDGQDYQEFHVSHWMPGDFTINTSDDISEPAGILSYMDYVYQGKKP